MALLDFDQMLLRSKDERVKRCIRRILLKYFPDGEPTERATTADDKMGIDWIVTFPSGRIIRIDIKIRDRDFAKFGGEDDLVLELSSVIGKVVGWTLDTSKKCEYVLWFWRDTGRHALFPFFQLLAVFREHRKEWVAKAERREGGFRMLEPQASQYNGTVYYGQAMVVPRSVIEAAIKRTFHGDPSFDYREFAVGDDEDDE